MNKAYVYDIYLVQGADRKHLGRSTTEDALTAARDVLATGKHGSVRGLDGNGAIEYELVQEGTGEVTRVTFSVAVEVTTTGVKAKDKVKDTDGPGD